MADAEILMCRPTFYGINYEINPWMRIRRQPNRPLALRQWNALRETLQNEMNARVHLIRAVRGLPDMCFTANAGIVHGRAFIPARFRYEERAGEEPRFTSWFKARRYRILPLPEECRFEGAGDALPIGANLIAGYFFRSDFNSHELIAKALRLRVFSVSLVNERFYHLDTCFAPISAGAAIYYPGAFDDYGLRVLRENVGELIPVASAEAYEFGCNAVCIGKKIVVSASCRKLATALKKRGYTVYRLDFSEFIKAGGAAKCLTLAVG